MSYFVGIDIGGTKCSVVLGEYSECQEIGITEKVVFPTDKVLGAMHTIDIICRAIEDLLKRNSLKPEEIEGIGISCGGPLDSNKGIILSPPNLIGWDDIPIVDILERKFGIKAKLQNDANACALAEWKFGAARGCRNVIFLTFGTGLGAGMILNGMLYEGSNGMAGEAGHVRLSEFGPVGYGKSGSFEGFCSGDGIAQLAKMKILEKFQAGEEVAFCRDIKDIDTIDAKIVGDAALAGDELAKDIYSISGRFLGRGLSVLIDILNPEIIVIGGIFGRCEELFRSVAMEVIKEESLSISANACRIVPAGLAENIGDHAALAAAVYE